MAPANTKPAEAHSKPLRRFLCTETNLLDRAKIAPSGGTGGLGFVAFRIWRVLRFGIRFIHRPDRRADAVARGESNNGAPLQTGANFPRKHPRHQCSKAETQSHILQKVDRCGGREWLGKK
jgi:hypothetical protein